MKDKKIDVVTDPSDLVLPIESVPAIGPDDSDVGKDSTPEDNAKEAALEAFIAPLSVNFEPILTEVYNFKRQGFPILAYGTDLPQDVADMVCKALNISWTKDVPTNGCVLVLLTNNFDTVKKEVISKITSRESYFVITLDGKSEHVGQ